MRPAVCALFLVAFLAGCSQWSGSLPDEDSFYRDEMRNLVIAVAEEARLERPDFLVVPQNGESLLTMEGDPDGTWKDGYASAIDGLGREDFLFGYDGAGRRTPADVREGWGRLLDCAERRGIQVLITDYCTTRSQMAESYAENATCGYAAFATSDRELASIPSFPLSPYGANDRSIERLEDAVNFLYLINPSQYPLRSDLVDALCATEYDLLILDLFAEDGTALTFGEIQRLKRKRSGAQRLVLAYLSIGEAEAYRDYWKTIWASDPPGWLLEENRNWEENYAIEYWNPAWHDILIFGEDAYLKRILRAGFDGVYLDRIDAYERFEGG